MNIFSKIILAQIGVASLTYENETIIYLIENYAIPMIIKEELPEWTEENEKEKRIINISKYLNLSQIKAANLLGVSQSTLGRRWRKSMNMNWPKRKIDRMKKKLRKVKITLEQKNKIKEKLNFFKEPIYIKF